jgi:colicin import membrane protein
MIGESSYKKAFLIALILHISLGVLLCLDNKNSRPVLINDSQNALGQFNPIKESNEPKQEIVKAISVDNKQVMDTVNRLKEERARQIKLEQLKQQALAKQAEQMRLQRIREQQRIVKLKEEAEKIAIARKKEMEKEKKRLKQLAMEKEQESKKLEAIKEKQRILEKLQREQAEAEELKKVQEARRAELAKREAQEAAEKQAAASARRARVQGEVDKYKAMIINAISQRWILPENVNQNLSSKFRIRLASDGVVLEVNLIRSSGDPILDRSAQTAIYKASPLPVPSDPETFSLFRDISLTVRPENVRG